MLTVVCARTRIAVLLATLTLALTVSCSHQPVPAKPSGAPTLTAAASAPPSSGAPVKDVISWIEAGKPANPTDFHTLTYDGRVTLMDASSDVAFRSPGPVAQRAASGCIFNRDSALHCLLPLRDAPARPNGQPGQWIGGWVDFDGDSIAIGSVHGDPGPFNQGYGRELPYGERLAFGEYQCRSDPTGLYLRLLRQRWGL